MECHKKGYVGRAYCIRHWLLLDLVPLRHLLYFTTLAHMSSASTGLSQRKSELVCLSICISPGAVSFRFQAPVIRYGNTDVP